MRSLSYGKQTIDEKDIQRVIKVLKSDWISSGPTIRQFEEQIASYCSARYAVAVSSGTAALHLACMVAGLGKGDEAITTPITFLATANSVAFTGATPVFADIDYETVNIDPSQIEKKINRKTKAILPVHFAGLPVEGKKIQKMAKKHKLIVIEDGCHAMGASYQGHKVGSCKYSDMTVFSFHPVKHITTGEGGCITTNNKKYYEQLMALRNHGTYKPKSKLKSVGGWYMEMRELGFNYRITDIQCALGMGQLEKLDQFVAKRYEVAKYYNHAWEDLQDVLKLPQVDFKDRSHSFHLYLLRLKLNRLKISRREVYDALQKHKIHSQVHYIPLTQQPYYKKTYGKKMNGFKYADKYHEEVLSLPIYPRLTKADMKHVAEVIRKIISSKIKK